MATSGESSKERYERAMAARKAREERVHAQETARRQALAEALAKEAEETGVERTTVLAPPDPNKSGAKQLGGILLIMLVITGVIAVIATIAAWMG